MFIRRFLTLIIIFVLAFRLSYSQLFPNLAIFGGPSAGWHFNNVNDLNTELSKAGFPKVATNGFFSMGGGGYIDLPTKKGFFRIGGMGTGFSTNLSQQVNDSLTKALNYAFGMGGLSVEYVHPIGNFDIIAGALFSTGTLKLDLYQYGKDNGNYSSVLGEFTNNSSSQNITRNFKVRFFSVQPQISFALLLKKFLYLKLTGGYLVTANGTWKVDNNIDVPNFPSGIKANGFTINLSVNAGIFF
ncbi:MAG: hypothetical protein ACHQJ4_02135, partial [Ignavibacteria bacterium]